MLSLPTVSTEDERGSGRIAAIKRSFVVPHPVQKTCSWCKEFDNGLCKLRARAEWENCYVAPDRKPCHFADLHEF
ncbi:hypothetical protein ACQ4M3_05205 [Leptolyngbya sp. AN03gr2]|uniref:hypothetical protein n=1 Tax=unclassified Leptolyngbya TaxID=2650499 RepID=UPI003D32325E